jgi:transglutaminase-like putative cysteine protease
MPLFERYAYKFFYASFYALMVSFYAIFVKDHKMSVSFIFLLRALSFVYVAIIAMKHNIGFAIIGFLTIYQITRFLDGSYFKNYVMSFVIYLGVFYLSIPNHNGIWILIYSAAFVVTSVYFLISHFIYYLKLEKPSTAKDFKEFHIYRLARVYIVYVIFIALLIFILMPRVKLNFFNPFHFRFAGMSSIFSFNSIENIKESSSVIMRITKDNDAGTHYKMKSFNRYWHNRREWIATGFGSRRLRHDRNFNFEINPDTSELTLAAGELVNATYYIKSNSEGYVPHLYMPVSANIKSSILYNDYIENLYASEAEGTLKVSSFVINPSEELLRNTQGPDPLRIANYYYFMYPSALKRIRQLAWRLTSMHSARVDKVNAIVSYLQNNFTYTTAVGDLYDEYKNSEYDPNEVFLFIIKAGHCEFFASSMTLMCQSVGIPARLVSGFASPEYNESGDYFLVRGSDAHAWVEVYFPNIGFVTFDPTAAAAANQRSRFKFFSFLNKYIDHINFYIENYVSYYSNEYIIAMAVDFYRSLKDAAAFAHTIYSRGHAANSPDGAKSDFNKNFKRDFKFNLLLFSPFFIFIFIITFSSKIKTAVFSFLSLFLGAGHSYKIAKIIAMDISPQTDFYDKFISVFAKNGIVKRPSETPLEFNAKIHNLNILPDEYYKKCEHVAGLFYSIKCALKTPEIGELDEADLMVMQIASKIGKKSKSRA